VLLRVTQIAPDPSGESWLSDAPCALRSRYLLNTLEVGRLKEGWSFFVTDHPKDSVLAPLERELERLSISGIVALGRQIAMALDAAHRAGVTHGDLKLDDVFIANARSRTEHLSLIGFGVLRAAILSLPPVNSGIFRIDGEGPSAPVQPRLPEVSDDLQALGLILRRLGRIVARSLDVGAARQNRPLRAAENAVLAGLSLIVETLLLPTFGAPLPSAWEIARDLARLEVVSRNMLPDVPPEPSSEPAPSADAPDSARPPVVVHHPHRKQQVDESLPKVIIREPGK
jgi:serine/threonine protein kinase